MQKTGAINAMGNYFTDIVFLMAPNRDNSVNLEVFVVICCAQCSTTVSHFRQALCRSTLATACLAGKGPTNGGSASASQGFKEIVFVNETLSI